MILALVIVMNMMEIFQAQKFQHLKPAQDFVDFWCRL